MKLPANGSIEFPVTEERVYDTQTSVSSLNLDGLLTYIRNKSISEAARRQLQQIADLKTQIANTDADKRSVTDQTNNLVRDEERNRQNIASLSTVSGQQQLVQDYARKLSDQETQIAALRDRETALDRQRASLQTQLNGLIEKLDF
jgi:chromosome segregation ATPase